MEIQSGSALRLKAMTLRGIGSYLHGERLDIRPLTVLCGSNGSGKSTWLAVLDLLKKHCANGVLPLLTKSDAGYINNYLFSLMRARSANSDSYSSGLDQFEDATVNELDEYGPLRTIGLHVMASSDLHLSPRKQPYAVEPNESTGIQELFWHGRVRRGIEFRLRFTLPGDRLLPAEASFEFAVKEKGAERYIVAATLAELLDKEDFRHLPNTDEQFPDEEFTLSVNRILLGATNDNDMMDIARVAVSSSGSYQIKPSADRRGDAPDKIIAELVLSRLKEIVGLVLDPVFYIGAIRGDMSAMVSDEETMESESEDPHPRDRSVGSAGENLLLRYREFALNQMIQARPPYSGYIEQELIAPSEDCMDVSPKWHWRIIDIFQTVANSYSRPELSRMWQSTDDLTRQRIYNLAQNEVDASQAQKLVLKLLNDALVRTDLYVPGLWEEVPKEARFLIDIGVDKLDKWDTRRLNRLLIQAVLKTEELYDDYTCYIFGKYFAVWMDSLLETHPDPWGHGGGESLTSRWQLSEGRPSGYLVKDGTCCLFGKGRVIPPDQSALFYSPCFPAGFDSGGLSNLSSGFGQIAPIVLQLGLMQPNELLCLENPEVHLHPRLQTKITEFLISEAWAGKTIIVETHSDLVIYRVLRAILQETIAQSAVAIYFVSLVRDSSKLPAYSRMEKISINERGQIDHWPDGFMDEDIKEFELLIDAMYEGEDAEDEDFSDWEEK